MINLDFKCAEASEVIKSFLVSDGKAKKEAESLITKALGVLQEDGLYAFYLYMKAKDKSVYKSVEKESIKLFKEAFPDLDINREGYLIAKDLVSELERLFLAKELLERTLVYARYHAKALGKTDEEGEAQMEGGS